MNLGPIQKFTRQDLVNMARRAAYDACGAEERLPHDHWYEACTKNKYWLAEMRQAAGEVIRELDQVQPKTLEELDQVLSQLNPQKL